MQILCRDNSRIIQRRFLTDSKYVRKTADLENFRHAIRLARRCEKTGQRAISSHILKNCSLTQIFTHFLQHHILSYRCPLATAAFNLLDDNSHRCVSWRQGHANAEIARHFVVLPSCFSLSRPGRDNPDRDNLPIANKSGSGRIFLRSTKPSLIRIHSAVVTKPSRRSSPPAPASSAT
jgi:hypothetical protein